MCSAMRSDGHVCHAPRLKDSSYCFWHDPAPRPARLQASRQGAATTNAIKSAPMLFDPHHIAQTLASTIEGVAHGAIDPKSARAVGYLLHVAVRISAMVAGAAAQHAAPPPPVPDVGRAPLSAAPQPAPASPAAPCANLTPASVPGEFGASTARESDT